MVGFQRSLIAAGSVLGLALAIPGLAWTESCPSQCASGKVALGVIAPISGPSAAFGQPAAKAIEIAVRSLNTAGGLLGIPVERLVGDDRCDAGMAATVAKRHVEQDKVNFVIGPLCPNVAMDAAPIYAKAGVIEFVPTITTVELTQRYPDNIFRIAATDQQLAQALGRYLDREQKGKKLTVVCNEIFYMRAMAEMVRLALPVEFQTSAQFEPLLDVPGVTDRLADKLLRDPPDIIYLALDAGPLFEFVGKLRTRGIKSLLIGDQHLLSQTVWRQAGKAIEGVLVIAPITVTDNAKFREAVDLLKGADVVPDLVALYSFAAVQTWAGAVRQAGSGEPKQVIEALRSGKFETAVGTVAFDGKGDRRDIRYSLLTLQAGRLITGVEWRQ
ncbi:MAG: branched-chain amino acid transport system substrate-binding protein [Alphaproteobacteria bacterium]|nr:branched-chain amino acid transport system substrate-binding protein [Alphaproteobacteria bacterium]